MKENTVRAEITTLIPFPSKGKLSNRQIDNKVKRLNELKAQQKELKKMRDALEKELRVYMGDMEFYETEHSVIHYPKFPRTAFDPESFQVKHPRLWKKFQVTKEQRKLTYDTI